MTEKWWKQYKDNKTKNQNKLFDDVESELKRRFKSEKSPEEMYSLCKTDNNYWKHYRWSETLDVDSVSLVLCKDTGCDLMYCQALTAKGKDKLYGCSEQYQNFRNCYMIEKRKFNASYSEQDWISNKTLIPEYIEAQLKIKKEQKQRMETYGEGYKVIKMDEDKLINIPDGLQQEMTQKKGGYF